MLVLVAYLDTTFPGILPSLAYYLPWHTTFPDILPSLAYFTSITKCSQTLERCTNESNAGHIYMKIDVKVQRWYFNASYHGYQLHDITICFGHSPSGRHVLRNGHFTWKRGVALLNYHANSVTTSCL